ncbi:MAG: hypothetical protein IAG13_20510 [Deltaproteobacteria bacterium]|nr:hypothetical protein [Nannocystaceae bacterium]
MLFRSPNALILLCATTVANFACGDDDSDSDSDAVDDSSTGDPAATDVESSGSDETAAAESSTGDDPFADCTRSVLEADLFGKDAWMGPGVDPDTGMLIDDGSTYVVSATYLALQPGAPALAAFDEVIEPIGPALLGNAGLIAVQLGNSIECNSARTFAVWRDEAAMMEFVMGDAHAAAIMRVGEISRGGSLVTHWSAEVSGINWDAALAKLEADEGPFY